MLRFIATFVLLVLMGGPALVASPSLKVDEAGRLLVDVDVGGRGTYAFLLDTGADRTVIFRTLTAMADLDAIPLKSRRVRTATGSREMQLYALDYIHALGRRLPIGETVVFPDAGRRGTFGILGVDLMRGKTLQVIGADATLLDEAPLYDTGGWLTVQGRPVGRGSLAVMVKVGDLEIPAFVDTGAATSVMNGPAMDAIEAAAASDLPMTRTTVTAAGGVMAARRVILPSLAIGEWVRDRQTVVSAQLPVFTFWGAREVPAMILGADILYSASGVAIDFEKWRLHMRPH